MFQVNFKEKVDIEDLVLPSKPIGVLNMETMDLKEECLEQMSNTMSIHESNKPRKFLMVHERINSSSFATCPDRNEVFQP